MHPNALTGEHRLGEGRSRHLAWRIVVIASAAIVMAAIVTMGLGGGDDSASGASTEQAPFFCARQIPC